MLFLILLQKNLLSQIKIIFRGFHRVEYFNMVINSIYSGGFPNKSCTTFLKKTHLPKTNYRDLIPRIVLTRA